MATSNPSARRQPKGDKRQRTRLALLDAARTVVREKGYERTTLADVAGRAGMTTGAIYGNFKNREELFVALGETYWAPIRPRLKPGATFAEAMEALAAATLAAVDERAPAAIGRLNGLAYTLASDALRRQVHDVTAASYEIGAAWLRGFDARDLPMPADQLVRVLHTLMEGLVLHRLLTPELYPDDVFYAAFAALARREG